MIVVGEVGGNPSALPARGPVLTDIIEVVEVVGESLTLLSHHTPSFNLCSRSAFDSFLSALAGFLADTLALARE